MRNISKGTKNVNDWERERERKGEDNTNTHKNLTLLLLEWNAIFFNSSSTYVLKQEKTITQCLLAVWNISKLHISDMISVRVFPAHKKNEFAPRSSLFPKFEWNPRSHSFQKSEWAAPVQKPLLYIYIYIYIHTTCISLPYEVNLNSSLLPCMFL